MEIWLDTTDLEIISGARAMGILHGVTTNPSLIAKSGKPMEDVLRSVLDVQPGPVTAQVIARDADGMVEQANRLRKFSKRLIIKIPVTKAGLEATHRLTMKNIPVMATVVFDPNQVLLAAAAGAQYIAPYLGRIEKSGKDAIEVLNIMGDIANLQSMISIIKTRQFSSKIIAASIKTSEMVTSCAQMGIGAITIPGGLFETLFQNEFTDAGIAKFEKDWEKAKETNLL